MIDQEGSVPAAASSSTATSTKPPFRALFWSIAILLGLLQAWARRHDVQPDGISYIEIAQAGGNDFINAYWSPLYPFLLRLTFRIFQPSPVWESTVVHLANLAIFLFSLVCFEVFINELIRTRDALHISEPGQSFVSARTLWIWGYVFFLWAGHFWVTPIWVTPDLCVAGLAYLATAALLRIYRGAAGWLTSASLGMALGVGYLAKAPMFLLAFVFLGCAVWLMPSSKRLVPLVITALFFFALFTAPLVISLSKAKGRLTFGDSGRINYAEFVNGAPKYVYWQGQPPGTGIPEHSTRKVLSVPPLYEFSTPIQGSYPPWYDPSYWYEGIEPHFALRGQLLALYRTASSYLRIFSVTGTFYAVFLALFLLRSHSEIAPDNSRERKGAWLLWIPAVAALVMYALVHVEARFVGGFLLMLLMNFLARARSSSFKPVPWLLKATYIMVLAPAIAIAWSASQNVWKTIFPKSFEQWEVARVLHDEGISPASRVGYIGTGLDAYWAHLAQVRIVAEIPDPGVASFVQARPEEKDEVMRKFREVGVKAVLTKYPDVAQSMQGWQSITGTRYFVWRPPAMASSSQESREH